jgi:hypothetical protein
VTCFIAEPTVAAATLAAEPAKDGLERDPHREAQDLGSLAAGLVDVSDRHPGSGDLAARERIGRLSWQIVEQGLFLGDAPTVRELAVETVEERGFIRIEHGACAGGQVVCVDPVPAAQDAHKGGCQGSGRREVVVDEPHVDVDDQAAAIRPVDRDLRSVSFHDPAARKSHGEIAACLDLAIDD